jgi:hypothetical protein
MHEFRANPVPWNALKLPRSLSNSSDWRYRSFPVDRSFNPPMRLSNFYWQGRENMARSSREIARKHHYVPEMFLSGFTNDRGESFVVDASTRSTFHSAPKGISAARDYNLIEAPGVPPDALENELGKFEGVIAPGIRRVRETASFGEGREDREDVVNFITLLAVRNPRTRKDMKQLYNGLFQALVVMPFDEKARWKRLLRQ